jgi:formate-dependent phosphoribosylglycinamide formyltransferase (GAR transformylase)
MSFTARILLLGSGDLGKEFAISAKRLGAHVVACDSYAGAPAMQVADEAEVFAMLDGERLLEIVKRHQPDFVVPEVEAIRTEALALGGDGARVDVRIFGKPVTRPWRRMGVALATGPDDSNPPRMIAFRCAIR